MQVHTGPIQRHGQQQQLAVEKTRDVGTAGAEGLVFRSKFQNRDSSKRATGEQPVKRQVLPGQAEAANVINDDDADARDDVAAADLVVRRDAARARQEDLELERLLQRQVHQQQELGGQRVQRHQLPLTDSDEEDPRERDSAEPSTATATTTTTTTAATTAVTTAKSNPDAIVDGRRPKPEAAAAIEQLQQRQEVFENTQRGTRYCRKLEIISVRFAETVAEIASGSFRSHRDQRLRHDRSEGCGKLSSSRVPKSGKRQVHLDAAATTATTTAATSVVQDSEPESAPDVRASKAVIGPVPARSEDAKDDPKSGSGAGGSRG